MFFRKERRVRSLGKESIEPEEIFFDSHFASTSSGYDQEKRMELPIAPWVIRSAFILVLGIPIILFGYTAFLHAKDGQLYASLARQNAEEAIPIYAARGNIYDRNGEIIATNTSVFDVEFRPPDFTGEGSDIERIATLISEVSGESVEVLINQMQTAKARDFARVLLATRLESEEIALLQDALQSVSGFVFRERTARIYPEGPYTTHITGYTGRTSEGGIVGKDGLELSYESSLQGTDGVIVTFVNSQGNVLGERIVREATSGADLHTTIDLTLQKIAVEELDRQLSSLGIRAGSIVVLDPRTGGVRALVSAPNFDPNIFRTRISPSTYAELVGDPKKPFFNRAIRGMYPTGSVIKPLIASAALESNIVTPSTIIQTRGSITVSSKFDPDVTYTFLDWKNHGNVDMRQALAVSSNVYFYIIGGGYKDVEGLGIDRIQEYLHFFGWGNKLGIDIFGEEAGRIPDPDWKALVKNEEWYIGDTYNVSIGQGDILATPLQVASSIAVIANGGTLFTPYLVEREGDKQRDIIQKDVPISEDTLRVVREGMRRAVLAGTSQQLQGLPVHVAGKTGTAEASGDNAHAWFTGFFPYEDPEFVIVVMLEDGEKSTEAVKTARRIIERYYRERP